MQYKTRYYYTPRFQYVSHNQHGARYKKKQSKQICTVILSCKRTNASDLEDLIVLSHTLNVPVHYDFRESRAYIEIMSSEAVRNEK